LLPEVALVGLVSAFDGFLASLLRVVFNKHEEIILTSQKQITYKELTEFHSIDEARTTLIEREIESVIRKSHHEQFDWMQNHLGLKLKKGLKIWPIFVELCERRNLFTHTAGIVSAQYIKNCHDHKCDISGINVGQRLRVDNSYFKQAVEAVYEVGIKLCYVFWRKFDEGDSEKADSKFNQRSMDLIAARSYNLAEALLMFSKTVPRIKDNTRRMMIVNLANAIRLQERGDEAKRLLDSEDWSATSNSFRICVASVRGNVDDVLDLMDELGTRFPAEDYRHWPVFRRTREDPRFMEKFETIFGEPLLLGSSRDQTATKEQESSKKGEEAPTVH
jgi:hypothetical protein